MRCLLTWWLAAGLLGLACAPVRPAAPPAPDLPGHARAETAITTPADPKQEMFEARVLPILQERCSPCHFEGGKMYDRLPFDKPGTIRVLGTALFTRIRDEEERQAIRDFLGITSMSPEYDETPADGERSGGPRLPR